MDHCSHAYSILRGFASRSWLTSLPGVTDHFDSRKQHHFASAPRRRLLGDEFFNVFGHQSLSILTAAPASLVPKVSF